MLLLLARHGNTFESHEKPTYVGLQDLPLTEKGKQQAKALGRSLVQLGLIPKECFASELQRTRVFAEIALSQIGSSPSIRIDSRLNEIDYGSWSGLSRDEVFSRFPNELSLFEDALVYPSTFSPSQEEIRAQLDTFLGDLVGFASSFPSPFPVLVVTSQAKLRHFQELDPVAWKEARGRKEFKMSPGHLSVLSCNGGLWKVVCWNLSPEEASASKELEAQVKSAKELSIGKEGLFLK